MDLTVQIGVKSNQPFLKPLEPWENLRQSGKGRLVMKNWNKVFTDVLDVVRLNLAKVSLYWPHLDFNLRPLFYFSCHDYLYLINNLLIFRKPGLKKAMMIKTGIGKSKPLTLLGKYFWTTLKIQQFRDWFTSTSHTRWFKLGSKLFGLHFFNCFMKATSLHLLFLQYVLKQFYLHF